MKEKEKEEKKEESLNQAQLVKGAALGIFAIILSVFVWYRLAKILTVNQAVNVFNIFSVDLIKSIAGTVFVFCLMISFLGLFSILVKDKKIAIPTLILSSFSYLFFFKFNLIGFISLILLLVGFWSFFFQVNRESRARYKFSITKSIKEGLGLIIFIILAVISLAYYSIITETAKVNMTTPVEGIAESATNLTNQFLKGQIPGYRPAMPLDDFLFENLMRLSKVIGEQSQDQSAGQKNELVTDIDVSYVYENLDRVPWPEIEQKLPPDIKKQAGGNKETLRRMIEDARIQFKTQVAPNLRKDFLEKLGITATGDDEVGAVLNKFFKDSLDKVLGPYSKWIPPFLAISLFFVLGIFSPFYKMLIKIIVILLTNLCFWFKVAEIKKEETEVEKVGLKG